MIGKNCTGRDFGIRSTAARDRAIQPALVAVVLMIGASTDSAAHAGQIRVWSSAVVVEDSIRLADVSEARGFDADEERRLATIVIAESPTAGGSRVVSIEAIRSALSGAGINMARVTFRGSSQAEVVRPATQAATPTAGPDGQNQLSVIRAGEPSIGGESRSESASGPSLRQVIQDFFDAEFGRYDGKAELVFDRADEQVLELAGPTYEFDIRRRGGASVGLCSLEIGILNNGRTMQTVPLVVQSTMRRSVVIARRSINLGATISAADVEATTMSFTRLDLRGIEDPAMAIGQRAKRFISGGAMLEVDMLESVPLVKRGQIVTLVSMSGGVRVVTTAKAAGDGKLGERVKVRLADDKHAEFDAVVVGPGEVRVGGNSSETRRQERLATRESR